MYTILIIAALAVMLYLLRKQDSTVLITVVHSVTPSVVEAEINFSLVSGLMKPASESRAKRIKLDCCKWQQEENLEGFNEEWIYDERHSRIEAEYEENAYYQQIENVTPKEPTPKQLDYVNAWWAKTARSMRQPHNKGREGRPLAWRKARREEKNMINNWIEIVA